MGHYEEYNGQLGKRPERNGTNSAKDRTIIANVDVGVWKGDITTLAVDAIVNAANGSLLGGGGIDGAIHRAAGPGLLKECEGIPAKNGVRCPVGSAVITKGYDLPAKFVIHTVGPQVSFDVPSEADRKSLEKCYESCLQLCDASSVQSVAFCCISCGIYRFPNDLAAKIAFNAVKEYLESHPATSLKRVVFCVFSEEQLKLYGDVLAQHNGDRQ
jgi:O-acetyl-ADP-ribose deacetylase (regulator of RNase III)